MVAGQGCIVGNELSFRVLNRRLDPRGVACRHLFANASDRGANQEEGATVWSASRGLVLMRG
jgi:hypothetical protein